jgi:hypothetical protein
MTRVRTFPGVCVLLCLFASLSTSARAQMIDDGIMLAKRDLFVGNLYTHDSWDEYWEGALKRDNGNIGTLTTQANVIFANYGLTDRLNVITTLPYVWTRASQGVLHGMDGFQDFTLAVKYKALEASSRSLGTFKAMAVVSGGTPVTDYTPDFQPLSIGFASKRATGRVTLNFETTPGWYVNGTSSYTWRGPVTLDRPYYYTNNQFFMTDEVHMPKVFDYAVSAGYLKHAFMTQVTYSQQRTRGGGDIRRQDMPFISNRMNFSKVGAMLMTPVPKLRNLRAHVAYAYTVDGRNVGQASTVTAGVFYLFHFHGSATP